jgi:small subunit ribosomal protein S17e
MGRIKAKLIKRTARQLVEKAPESFDKDFDVNKKALGSILASKKTRNKIAGYISRIKKSSKTLIKE